MSVGGVNHRYHSRPDSAELDKSLLTERKRKSIFGVLIWAPGFG